MAGWIKIDRNIRNHWIWSDPIKFQWWFDIIMTVNYEDKKVPIGFRLLTCYRGESLMSIGEWAKRWKVSKSIVNRFFIMLKNDGMIETKSETVTIRLKVCNYDSYQDFCNASESQTNRKRIANESQTNTTKEGKEIKEIKERKETISKDIAQKKVDAKASTLTRRDEFYKSLIPFLSTYGKDMIRDFFDYWSEQNKSGTQMRFEKQPTWEVAKRLATWNKRDTFKNQNNGNTKIQSTSSREAKEQSRRNLVKLADQILGIDESEDNGRSFR